jgi:hypothetical protein
MHDGIYSGREHGNKNGTTIWTKYAYPYPFAVLIMQCALSLVHADRSKAINLGILVAPSAHSLAVESARLISRLWSCEGLTLVLHDTLEFIYWQIGAAIICSPPV